MPDVQPMPTKGIVLKCLTSSILPGIVLLRVYWRHVRAQRQREFLRSTQARECTGDAELDALIIRGDYPLLGKNRHWCDAFARLGACRERLLDFAQGDQDRLYRRGMFPVLGEIEEGVFETREKRHESACSGFAPRMDSQAVKPSVFVQIGHKIILCFVRDCKTVERRCDKRFACAFEESVALEMAYPAVDTEQRYGSRKFQAVARRLPSYRGATLSEQRLQLPLRDGLTPEWQPNFGIGCLGIF